MGDAYVSARVFEVQRADREIARHRAALKAGRGDPAYHRRKLSEWFEYRCQYVDPREKGGG
jgi:hypothetical protein